MSHLKIWFTIPLFVLGAGIALAQDAPAGQESDAGSKEHQWLQQLVGKWEIDMEGVAAPDAEPTKAIGSEAGRLLGQSWLVAEGEVNSPGGNIHYLLTIGFDPEKKKYVGSWVCGEMPQLWVYEGTVNESGTTLTLESEGPDMSGSGKTAKYRDLIEMKSKDHRVHTSQCQGPDGQWTSFATANYRRKK